MEKHARNILASLQLESGEPNTLKRINEIEDFWGYGKSSIKSAEFLFRNFKTEAGITHFYGMGILLIHGTELLLKALLRIKDEDAFKILMRGGKKPKWHEYETFYEEGKKFYKTLREPELSSLIKNMASKFSRTSRDARYDFVSGKFLMGDAFRILNEKLILPHEKHIEEFISEHFTPS